MNDPSETFSTAMLILAATNDLADSELREAVNKLKKHNDVTRQARTLAEIAFTSSDDVQRRMRRFLTQKGVWQQYVYFMDKRQEQMDYHLNILRVSIKQAADDVKDDNSQFIADTCLAAALLQVAVQTYRRLVNILRMQRIDVTRIWKGMSMQEPAKFYKAALRHIKLKSSPDTEKSIERSTRIAQAVKVFTDALYSPTGMHEAELYAQEMKQYESQDQD